MRRLEEKYAREIFVVGVHAGKYTAERVSANLRNACLRLGVEHPVVNDRFYRIWKSFSVSAWPTIVFVDPLGRYVGSQPGEFRFEDFDELIGNAVQEYDRAGILDRREIPLTPEQLPATPLRFPGKVLAAPGAPDLLYIADSDHHRVVCAALDEKGRSADVRWIAGSGAAGLSDGAATVARFNCPQGMALGDDTLYIADRENHAIRALDLATQQLRTVAGTGELGYSRTGGPALATALNSPWDLLWLNGRLFIAMAGRHQIWVYDPGAGIVEPFAGSGREALEDGPLAVAALAQPTGISSDGTLLYFACSEAQAIRACGTDSNSSVMTIVGTGLFDFGDKDGKGDAVRLQHPFAVAYHKGSLFVADSYNSKIKRVDPYTRSAATFAGTGERGLSDGAASTALFDEPEGLTVLGDTLYIADTNNHAIRRLNLHGEPVVETVEISGL